MSFDPIEVLSLRRWTLSILCVKTKQGGLPMPLPPAASPASWEAFLRLERCAWPLQEHLDSDVAGLPDHARKVVAARAGVEIQRALSARARLRMIARMAQERQLRVLVLKGGVALLHDIAVDVMDVDVLVEPDVARDLAGILDADGFAKLDWGGDLEAVRHLQPRHEPNAVQIELHWWFERPGDARELLARGIETAAPPLLEPDYADHLWQVLSHSVEKHPDRRGAIRDVLVVADAAARCNLQQLAGVAARIRGRPSEVVLTQVLTLARSLNEHSPIEDPFELFAYRRYALIRQLQTRRWDLVDRAGMRDIAVRLLCRPGDWRPELAYHVLNWSRGSSRSSLLNRWARSMPRTVDGLRLLLRSARTGMAMLIASYALLRYRHLPAIPDRH